MAEITIVRSSEADITIITGKDRILIPHAPHPKARDEAAAAPDEDDPSIPTYHPFPIRPLYEGSFRNLPALLPDEEPPLQPLPKAPLALTLSATIARPKDLETLAEPLRRLRAAAPHSAETHLHLTMPGGTLDLGALHTHLGDAAEGLHITIVLGDRHGR